MDRREHRRPPYGVDIVIPNKYEGMDSHLSAEELAETLRKMVPQEHLDFGKKILADHGVPVEDSDGDTLQLLGWTEATATPQVEVALKHPKVKMIANALGTPPADMIKHIHEAGLKVAALCGSPRRPASTRTRASTSSSRRAARPAGTAARWAQSCCGRRSSRRSLRFRCWPPAASAAASRSRPRWRWAHRARGPDRSG